MKNKDIHEWLLDEAIDPLTTITTEKGECYLTDILERHLTEQLRLHDVSTSKFMKERRGYRRELLRTRYDDWMERTEYKWQYTWSDGTKSIRYSYRY